MATDPKLSILRALDAERKATGDGNGLYGQDADVIAAMIDDKTVVFDEASGDYHITSVGLRVLDDLRQRARERYQEKKEAAPVDKPERKYNKREKVMEAAVSVAAAPAVQIETTCQHDDACATCEVMEMLMERVPAVRELYDLVAAKRELAGREDALLTRIGGGK